MTKLALTTTLFLLLAVPSARAAGDWTWPVRGPVITQYRNGGDPYAAGQHRGIDIGAPVGTPVVAAAAGTVAFAGVVGSSGLTVSERTADGRYELSYLHLSTLAVHAGDHLERGERLGAVGTSGRRSAEQPHLHFGVRDASDRHAYHDPLDFLGAPPPADEPQRQPTPVPVASPEPAGPSPAPVATPVAAPSPGLVGTQAGAAAALSQLPSPLLLPAASRGPTHSEAHAPAALGGSTATAPRIAAGHGHVPGRGPAHRAVGTAHRPVPGHGPQMPDVAHARTAPVMPAHGPSASSMRTAPATGPTGRAPASRARRAHDIDLGWLAACFGLVTAATLLARPARRDGRRRHRTGTTPLTMLARILGARPDRGMGA